MKMQPLSSPLTLHVCGDNICVKLIKTVEVALINSNLSDVPDTDEGR